MGNHAPSRQGADRRDALFVVSIGMRLVRTITHDGRERGRGKGVIVTTVDSPVYVILDS